MNKRRLKSQIVAEILKKPGFKPRVDAFCVQCIYDEKQDGTYRMQVSECTVKNCALFPVRMKTRALSISERQ